MASCIAGLAKRGFVPAHVIDVGGSDGRWTKEALRLWPNARYSLFEPLREHAASLQSLVHEYPGVSWFPCALGREKTSLPLSVVPGKLDDSSLAYSAGESRDVPVESLDGLLTEERLVRADLLKIDVQGFEREILLGGERLLAHVQVVITETYFFRFAPQMTLFHEMVGFMSSRGFRVYEVIDPLPRPLDQAVGQCDICFVREGNPLLRSNAWT